MKFKVYLNEYYMGSVNWIYKDKEPTLEDIKDTARCLLIYLYDNNTSDDSTGGFTAFLNKHEILHLKFTKKKKKKKKKKRRKKNKEEKKEKKTKKKYWSKYDI